MSEKELELKKLEAIIQKELGGAAVEFVKIQLDGNGLLIQFKPYSRLFINSKSKLEFSLT